MKAVNIFGFKIALVKESELPNITGESEPAIFKTVYAKADTEEEAFQKVDLYVKNTKYADIEDRKIVS